MKKYLIVVLAFLLVFISACSKDKEEEKEQDPNNNPQEEAKDLLEDFELISETDQGTSIRFQYESELTVEEAKVIFKEYVKEDGYKELVDVEEPQPFSTYFEKEGYELQLIIQVFENHPSGSVVILEEPKR